MEEGSTLLIPHFPDRVKSIINLDGDYWIGLVDQTTVLKYPQNKEYLSGLAAEWEIYQRLGKHPRITEVKGRHKDGGIFLEYFQNGWLDQYLLKNPKLSVGTRLRLAQETAEGVAHVHQQNILVCDITARNILLDSELHVKLCDFQGKILGPDGTILLAGDSSELPDACKPRDDPYDHDISTDIFALGSTLYFIMAGHQPFSELNIIEDEVKIRDSFRQGRFPRVDVAEEIIHRCWSSTYTSVQEIVDDLSDLRRKSETGLSLRED
ncbi:kinase-like protein [Pseudovirgaria hyperparasitica]|uniref:Kinase-like protein n=1 Tax=Pseudovirgaria hyperparasitica TaxID=470096 RepID=A0A6A6WF43_9PEZI|nr:kinase-like protein [Pseudovirgaria hyperparasitica]KAF2761442.1 kinase-like protein [Pseudovirgaria hyperparasitica]